MPTTFDETSYLPPEQAQAQLDALAPGQSFVFAKGATLSQFHPTVQIVYAAKRTGCYTIHNSGRDSQGRLLQRLRRVPDEHSGPMIAGRRVDPEISQPQERALYAVLSALAAAGQCCPSNARLAELAGLRARDADAVRYRLKRLTAQGLIRLANDKRGARVVWIIATGERTA